MLHQHHFLQKFLCLILILSLLLLPGCGEQSENIDSSPSTTAGTDLSQEKGFSEESLEESFGESSKGTESHASLQYIVLQRGNSNPCRVVFSDIKTSCVEELVLGITRVLWMEQRGQSYPKSKEISLSSVPEIEEISNLVITEPPQTERYSKTIWYDTVLGSGTWVLLDYDSIDSNMMVPRGDLIFYTSNQEGDIAYLAVEMADGWQVTQLPGYSDWIARECDIVLRMAALG